MCAKSNRIGVLPRSTLSMSAPTAAPKSDRRSANPSCCVTDNATFARQPGGAQVFALGGKSSHSRGPVPSQTRLVLCRERGQNKPQARPLGAPFVADQKPSASIEAVESGLAAQGYIASRQIATAVYLAQQIEKPILVEGPAGVGKTELAKAIAAWRGMKMIRLQCYEGLDEAKALYEWKYAKQLLYTQVLKDKLGEALKRRCLHLHIGFPEQRLEERIVESRVPGISQTLRKQMVGFIHEVRTLDLKKLPSVSETIDWARVLVLLQASELGHEMVKDTLNVLLKYEADIEATQPQMTTFVAKASRQNVFG